MRVCTVLLWVLWTTVSVALAEPQTQPPDLMEVYGLIRSNLVGIQQTDLDGAALEGILTRFRGRVFLSSDRSTGTPESEKEVSDIVRTNLFANRFAYIRLSRIGSESPAAFIQALDRLGLSNRLDGLVLDLRFTEGTNYTAAARIADCFISDATALLQVRDEKISSTSKTNAFTSPVVVLVNSKTSGAAEALGAVLRRFNGSLLIGNKTAGHAGVFDEFKLSTGHKLMIATAHVTLGSGEQITPEGLAPDITVKVDPEEELLYLEDPYRKAPGEAAVVSASPAELIRGTNRPPREADLVRMRREGSLSFDLDQAQKAQLPAESMIRDPVLVRALDLLTGLAVVRQEKTEGRRRTR